MSRVYLSPPDVGDAERDALLRAFDTGWIAPVGPEIDEFEREIGRLVGWHAVGLSSGTAALHLALLAVGVGHGDLVYCSTFTFAASANAITYCGAQPVFIDSEPSSWNINPALLHETLSNAARRNALPKAIVVVDLYGQCADFDQIMPICREYGVAVVEDAAEALGARYRNRPAGALADISILSFNGNKIITTSGGGMLLSPDEEVAARCRYLSTQARQAATHYEHTEIGYNYRLSNLLAALGRAQLKRLPAMSARRLEINRLYREALDGLPLRFMPVPAWSQWNGWLTCTVFDHSAIRDRVMRALDADDIESRPLWKPLHLQPVFQGAPATIDGTSEGLFGAGICLPSGSALDEESIQRVVEIVIANVD
jgi:dTDP-4-amino-4,6-dideoxygalactose transaminase